MNDPMFVSNIAASGGATIHLARLPNIALLITGNYMC